MDSYCLAEEKPSETGSAEVRGIELQIPEDCITDLDAVIAAFGILVYRYSGASPVVFDLTAATEPGVAAPKAKIELSITGAALASLTAAVGRLDPTRAGRDSCVRCALPRDISRFLRMARTGSQDHARLDFVFSQGGARLECSADVYEEELLGPLAQHFARLLRAAVCEPHRPVSEFPMMSSEEREHILVRLNGAGEHFAETTIPAAFEAQVNRKPDAPALTFDGEAITFRELHERALRVAAVLQQSGVGVETLVGVYMDNPIAAAITYFAIVIAGGVLVPLDSEWPRDRLREVTQNANLQLIVTAGATAADLWTESLSRLDLSSALDSGGFDQASTARPFTAPALKPDNAAYVVYTSGSTGAPKGVVCLHSAIPSAAAVAVPMPENEVFAVGANLALGAGLIGLFHALIQGAGIFLVSAQLARDLPRLVDAWERAGVTRIVMVAPQLRQLCLLDGIGHRLKRLRLISHAGSALSPDLLPSIYEAFPQATLINSYTSIEMGTAASRWVSTPAMRRYTVTVGPVLPNVRVYILSPDGEPVPLGVPGEIYVGSADLSRGYLNQPKLTRERFLPNPFPTPGIPRVYRTGDVGRMLPNGELEYLGRVDNQVKVRGMRVELEEIELFLHRHPDVHHVAVAALPWQNDCRLTAFVTPKPDRTLSVTGLREHLASGLPGYCIPALFVIADQLPMTRNGKIDRQNLPKIGAARPEIETLFVAPRDPAERSIQSIWERELGFEGIGVNDHFLELGGDSLLAVRIAVELQAAFGVNVPVITLFDYPTIAELAMQLAGLPRADAAE